jgi:hypothetical protein
MQSEVGQQQEEVQQPEVDMHSEVVELVGQHHEVVQIQQLIQQPKANV